MRYATGQANRLGNRVSNQDRCLVAEREDAVLLAVADGMGGHARGDLAAQTFVDCLHRKFRGYQGLEEPGQFLREAFQTAHKIIQRVGQTQKPPIEPLTTGVACLIQDGVARWAHVGDSRAYLIRQGQVALRTRDHSRVAEMVDAGVLTEQQARQHPLRNHVSLCLGGTAQPPPVSLGPKVYLLPGDILLLCSDGLWSAIAEQRLISTLEAKDLPQAIDQLAGRAERASYPQSDNVSGVTLRWDATGPEPNSAATPTVEATDPAQTRDPVDRAIAEIHQALEDYAGEMTDDK